MFFPHRKTYFFGKCVSDYHVVVVAWFWPQHCSDVHRSRCSRLIFEASEIGLYFVLIYPNLKLIGKLNLDF